MTVWDEKPGPRVSRGSAARPRLRPDSRFTGLTLALVAENGSLKSFWFRSARSRLTPTPSVIRTSTAPARPPLTVVSCESSTAPVARSRLTCTAHGPPVRGGPPSHAGRESRPPAIGLPSDSRPSALRLRGLLWPGPGERVVARGCGPILGALGRGEDLVDAAQPGIASLASRAHPVRQDSRGSAITHRPALRRGLAGLEVGPVFPRRRVPEQARAGSRSGPA